MNEHQIWQRTADALEHGDFTLLDELLNSEDVSIVELLEANGEPPGLMSAAFAWACFTGRTAEAEALLDKGVDPAKCDKTGLSGFHWAASRAHLDTVKMLVRRKAPLEQLNMYGGTVLGQTLWSTIYESKDGQVEVIEVLIAAGAKIEPGTLQWWNGEPVPSDETKARVAKILRRSGVE